MSKNKIRNAHCAYFEGQTGLCKAKEFVKCNPLNCKLYTIDELSTILDLQEQLKRKEQECEELKEKLERQKDYTITYKSYIYEEEKQLKKQLQAKEQECEKLKTQYNCYACGTCKGKEDYRNMKRHCENSIKANHRYKQSLDEIEKYIKGSSGYYIPYGAIEIIQYIINKAKDGE